MNNTRLATRILVLVLLLAVLVGCGDGSSTIDNEGRLKVTVTTGMIGDVVKNVGGQHVAVTALMGPGVDPHLYKASEGDNRKLSGAGVIFFNGLDLEGKLGAILDRMAKERPVVAVGDAIPPALLTEHEEVNALDPHIWFDVQLWMRTIDPIRDQLTELIPEHKAEFAANAEAYRQTLVELDAYARQQMATIPPRQRVLVTAHDAFGYFGRAYDIEVMALQGLSTDAEYGLAEVQGLVTTLVERQIKAVFVESSIPTRSIEAVVEGARARGHSVVVGGELFSDAMGPEGSPEGTYVGMVRHNVDIIVNALR